MDAEPQIEPLVSKDEIWVAAKQAADARQCVHESNPFPQRTQAHLTFETYYWQRMRELDGETDL